jgi:hypothetical protein
MRYECDAPNGLTWFRLENAAEADAEAAAMAHAVDKFYKRAEDAARASYQPGPGLERDIGLKDHIARAMPLFLTLRDAEGTALVTAMIPQKPDPEAHELAIRPILVAQANKDPYPPYAAAIDALARHLRRPLGADECYPYRRG